MREDREDKKMKKLIKAISGSTKNEDSDEKSSEPELEILERGPNKKNKESIDLTMDLEEHPSQSKKNFKKMRLNFWKKSYI